MNPNLLSVDPGERHVGLAVIDMSSNLPLHVDTMTPDQFVDWFLRELDVNDGWDQVICEEFRVYDTGESTWSEVRTVEIIGVLRHHCRRAHIPFNTDPKPRGKTRARAMMRYHGVGWPDMGHIPSGLRGHAKDALAHGHAWLWKRDEDGA